jgi:ATP-dependent Zn protease
VRRILDKAYKTAHEIISNNKSSLDRIARKLLERARRWRDRK